VSWDALPLDTPCNDYGISKWNKHSYSTVLFFGQKKDIKFRCKNRRMQEHLEPQKSMSACTSQTEHWPTECDPHHMMVWREREEPWESTPGPPHGPSSVPLKVHAPPPGPSPSMKRTLLQGKGRGQKVCCTCTAAPPAHKGIWQIRHKAGEDLHATKLRKKTNVFIRICCWYRRGTWCHSRLLFTCAVQIHQLW
jgi:hypothetical protein